MRLLGDDDVDHAARRVQLTRQLLVGAFGVRGEPPRQWLERLREGDVEVRRGQREPLRRRIDLGIRGEREEAGGKRQNRDTCEKREARQ